MNDTAERIQEKASKLYDALERVKRTDDSEYVRLKDGSPEWMTDVIREAHGDMFPDDWKYTLIERAAAIIAENESEDDWSSGVDQAVDVYTGQLTHWLTSTAWPTATKPPTNTAHLATCPTA